MVDLSIIIAAKNEERDLPECINSILSSKIICAISFEIIVIDDSADQTSEIIFKKFSDRVIHCSQMSRRGRCGARNLGIDLSTGDYLIILNADVFLDKNYFEFVLRVISEKQNGVFLFKDNVLVPKNEPWSHYEMYMQGEEWYRYAINSINPVWTEGFLISRKDLGCTRFVEFESMNLASGEDLLFGKELADKGIRFRLTDTTVSHRGAKTFSEFALMQKDRGVGGAQMRLAATKQSEMCILLIEMMKLMRSFLVDIVFLKAFFKFYGIHHQLISRSITVKKIGLLGLVLFVPFLRSFFGIRYACKQVFGLRSDC